MNSNEIKGDDLTIIRGIGSARQKWFSESLNVRTYRELAALSVDQIEAQLKAKGQIASRDKIEQWITQARELATTAGQPSGRGGEWKPFASFIVEFQTQKVEGQAKVQRTLVHHMETDKTRTWSGLESESLCRWMLNQLNIKDERRPERREKLPFDAQPAALSPAAVRPVEVGIPQIRVFQPTHSRTPTATGEAGCPFLGFVRSHEALALEVPFEVVGPGAVETTKERRVYCAQFYAHDLTTGATTHLGDTEPGTLIENQFSYTATLPGVVLQPGRYRVQVVTMLEGCPQILGYLEIPLLQVV